MDFRASPAFAPRPVCVSTRRPAGVTLTVRLLLAEHRIDPHQLSEDVLASHAT
jgi:hypothetical protein